MPRCFTGWQCGQCSAGVKIVFSFRAFTPAALVPRWCRVGCRVGVALCAVLDVPCYLHRADCVMLSVLCYPCHIVCVSFCCWSGIVAPFLLIVVCAPHHVCSARLRCIAVCSRSLLIGCGLCSHVHCSSLLYLHVVALPSLGCLLLCLSVFIIFCLAPDAVPTPSRGLVGGFWGWG